MGCAKPLHLTGDRAVIVQEQPAIGRPLAAHGEGFAARRKLESRGGCAQQWDTPIMGVYLLVGVAKNRAAKPGS